MIDMLIYCINVVTLHWYPIGQKKSVPFPSMLRVFLKQLLLPVTVSHEFPSYSHRAERTHWNIKGHISMWRLAPAHLQVKGRKEIFATRNSKLWPLSRSVPIRQRLTPVTGTFWFPHALCKIGCAHNSMAAKCQVLHLSAWRHSETLARKGTRIHLLKCTPCRRARLGEGSVKPCPTTGVRSHVCWHSLSPVLLTLAPLWPGPVQWRGWGWDCWKDREGVSLFPCCSRWGLVRGRRVHHFRAGNEVVCRFELGLQTQAGNLTN